MARPDTVVHGDAAVQPLPAAPAIVVRVLVRRHRARHAVHHHRRAPHREAGVQNRRPFHRTRRRGGQEEDDGLRGGARGGRALPSGGASRRPLARHGAGARPRAHEPHHVKQSDQALYASDVLLPELMAGTVHGTVMHCCRSCTAQDGSIRRSESETRGRDPYRSG